MLTTLLVLAGIAKERGRKKKKGKCVGSELMGMIGINGGENQGGAVDKRPDLFFDANTGEIRGKNRRRKKK